MTKKELTIYEKLTADFPKEAYTEDSSRGFALTTLKAQYIRERLNEVFGFDGWKLCGEYEPVQSGILFKGTLLLKKTKQVMWDEIEDKNVYVHSDVHEVEAIGFSAIKKNLGDSYKSAQTDALSKCASFIGVGNDMFKGKIKVGKSAPDKNSGKVYNKKLTKKEMQHDGPTVEDQKGFNSEDIPF